MLVLGIETATNTGSVALVREKETISISPPQIVKTHSQSLLKSINDLLTDAKLSIKDVNGVAISIGPGSFTGLRIGLSVAKSIAYSTGCDIIGVSTLKAFALRHTNHKGLVAPLIDARRNEIYGALFEVLGDAVHRKTNDMICEVSEFIRLIGEPVTFAGSGALKFKNAIVEELREKALFATPDLQFPSAETVAHLGLKKILTGNKDDVKTLTPVYIRKSDAEIKMTNKKDSS